MFPHLHPPPQHTHKPSSCVPSPAPTPLSTHTNPHHAFPHLHPLHSTHTNPHCVFPHLHPPPSPPQHTHKPSLYAPSPAPTPHTNPQHAYLFLHKTLISRSPCNFCSHTDPPQPPTTRGHQVPPHLFPPQTPHRWISLRRASCRAVPPCHSCPPSPSPAGAAPPGEQTESRTVTFTPSGLVICHTLTLLCNMLFQWVALSLSLSSTLAWLSTLHQHWHFSVTCYFSESYRHFHSHPSGQVIHHTLTLTSP